MRFEVDILFSGFSGKLETGYLGWGTWAAVKGDGHIIMLDTGFVGLRKDYANILESHKINPKSVDYVLLTHLHFDHVANIDQYPNATFVLSRQEWEYAHNPKIKDMFIEQSAVAMLDKAKLMLVEDGDIIIPGITAMLTPGHTPGCCSYILHQDEMTKWVLAGDAVKNRGEMAGGIVQMTGNPAVSENSICRIRAAGSRVLPGHDGWITIKDGKIIAEGGNDKILTFGQGVTINSGQERVMLCMDGAKTV